MRDSLSLLDRGLLSVENGKELNLDKAQEIFGYFDKSHLIDIFELILKGQEKKVIEIYRKIYDQGVEPKVFINDFLELIYYFKNIESLTIESTNFSLNDEEFSKIKTISQNVDKQILILFWQFTIKTLSEIDIVSNQNLSVEMFLIRLMYLNSTNIENDNFNNDNFRKSTKKVDFEGEIKKDAIDQIKNVIQEKKTKPQTHNEIKSKDRIMISSFEDLIGACEQNKEIKLKYELEKNVNLVYFEKNRVEISFNENLDKNFVKDLSLKLYEWTNERWIITFSKIKGDISVREKKEKKRLELFEKIKDTEIFKRVKEKFPDANLVDVKKKD